MGGGTGIRGGATKGPQFPQPIPDWDQLEDLVSEESFWLGSTFAFVPKFWGGETWSLTFVFVWILLTMNEQEVAVKLAMLILCLWYSEYGGLTIEKGRSKERTSVGPFPLKRIQKKRNQGYLFTLCSVEHHQAVTFATLGWRSEFPQFVGLSSLGHLGVSKRARGAGRLHHHLT